MIDAFVDVGCAIMANAVRSQGELAIGCVCEIGLAVKETVLVKATQNHTRRMWRSIEIKITGKVRGDAIAGLAGEGFITDEDVVE